MIFALLIVVGLCFGSFVNALVWRVHEQAQEAKKKKPDNKYLKRLSIGHGRSMCPSCKHTLATKDLIPLISWISLKGRCRYCNKPISKRYPSVEALLALLYVISYLWWPVAIHGNQIIIFLLWLVLLIGLVALLVYDVLWMLLPNKFLYPLYVVAAISACVSILIAARPISALINDILAIVVGGGIFYVLFQVSDGKWIGGGDVKLGFLLGLLAATPARSFLLIFIAALLGSFVSVPLLVRGKMKRNSTIPFGPFLIIGLIIVQIFGVHILHWYQQTFITM
jgi:prepilin signal peptidase PulO-like enzyme (type II secretory pathway)